ncbi:MAG TPA: hypothetical protein VF867_14345 [Arthrobacter sp.]
MSIWATGTYELLMQNIEDDLLMLTVFAVAVDKDEEDWDSPILAQVEIDRDERAPLLKPIVTGLAGVPPEELEFTLGARLALRSLMLLHEAALQDARGLDLQDAPWREPRPEALAAAERFNDAGLLLATRLFSM